MECPTSVPRTSLNSATMLVAPFAVCAAGLVSLPLSGNSPASSDVTIFYEANKYRQQPVECNRRPLRPRVCIRRRRIHQAGHTCYPRSGRSPASCRPFAASTLNRTVCQVAPEVPGASQAHKLRIAGSVVDYARSKEPQGHQSRAVGTKPHPASSDRPFQRRTGTVRVRPESAGSATASGREGGVSSSG